MIFLTVVFFFYISQPRNSCSDVMLLFRFLSKHVLFGVCGINIFALEMSAPKVKGCVRAFSGFVSLSEFGLPCF